MDPLLPQKDDLDPSIEREFWLFSLPYIRPTFNVLCLGSIFVPLLVIGAIIAVRGSDNISVSAAVCLLLFPVCATGIYFLTLHPRFLDFYRSVSLICYATAVVVLHVVAMLALETGRHAALDALLFIGFAGILTPFKVMYKASLIALTLISIAWARHYHFGEPLAYQLIWSVIMTFFVTAVGAVHDRSNRQAFLVKRRFEAEQRRSESLLRKIYPEAIYQKIKGQAQPHFVQHFTEVSILFADIVGFTAFCATRTPEDVVQVLDEITSRLDASCAQIGAVKIKTVGDSYLAVTGLPDQDPGHVEKIADLAIEFREAVAKYASLKGLPLQVRIGVHTGPVVAGIIGRTTSHFDLWGDAVNVAARLESSSLPGKIQVSEELANRLKDRYLFTDRGVVDLKGRGPTRTFILENPRIRRAAVQESKAA